MYLKRLLDIIFTLPRWYAWPSVLLGGALSSLFLFPIFPLFKAPVSIFANALPWKILYFTFLQASIGAGLCVVVALACVLPFQKLVRGRLGGYLENFLNIHYHLPSIVGCLALVALFGQNGLISKFCSFFGVPYRTFLYGMYGIITCHFFYYVPFALQALSRALTFLPGENERLAQSIGVKGWNYFWHIVWPLLKNEARKLFCLIFLCCARSFTVVLLLGGACPSTTTLEVALFQELHYNANLGVAAQLILLQGLLHGGIFYLTHRYQTYLRINIRYQGKPSLVRLGTIEKTILGLLIVFIMGPLLTLLHSSLSISLIMRVLSEKVFWESLGMSLCMGIGTAAVALLLSTCHVYLYYRHAHRRGRLDRLGRFVANAVAYLPLIISPLVVGAGLLSIAYSHFDSSLMAMLLVCLMNAIAITPTVYRILCFPYVNQRHTYDSLCATLGLQGQLRWRHIDWPILKGPLGYAIATCLTFSLADTRSILFFNNGQLSSLTVLIYDKMRQYAFEEAAVIGCFMILLSYGIFAGIQKLLTPSESTSPKKTALLDS